ncbi:MAG: flavodoxin family protein [Desulfarculus sp.]|nr:flavodoxin family protein [Desulfarculus sp.]
MQVLALNATGRAQGTTSALCQAALEGAASLGAATEMVLLKDHDIRFCVNCLTCYQDLESMIAPCSIEDGVTAILEKIKAADGVIFASPVHSGFVTGLMTTFLERAAFRLCSPTGEVMGLKGCPAPRLTGKPRAAASILSAGMIPPEARQYCDLGTPWLKENVGLLVNGPFIGDIYAGAIFDHPLSAQEATRGFLLRRLTPEQLEEARQLGVKMAQAIQDGLEPYSAASYESQLAGLR